MSIDVPGWRTEPFESYNSPSSSSSSPSTATYKDKNAPVIPLWHRIPRRAGCLCADRCDVNCWAPISRQEFRPDQETNAKPLVGAARDAAASCVPWWRELAAGVVVICLEDRNDRFEAACDRLHAAGLCTEAVFYRPRRPDPLHIADNNIKRGGRFGCFEAHREVAMAGLRAQLPSLLVLEDDFMLLPSPLDVPSYVRKAVSCFRALPDDACDMFLLGGLPLIGVPFWSRIMMGNFDAFRALAVCMHAYIAKPSFLARLAATSYLDNRRRTGTEGAVDWFATGSKQICFSPQFIGQSCMTTSDISSDSTEKENMSWDDHIGPAVVRFARDHPLAYDVTVFAIIPLLLLLFCILLLRRFARFLFGSPEPIPKVGTPFILASTLI